MFFFLHYAVKAGLGVALVGIVAVVYVHRHWFDPVQAWMDTLERVETEVLPVLGTNSAPVSKVVSGDTLVVRVKEGPLTFRVAGIQAPPAPRTRNPKNPTNIAFQRSKSAMAAQVLSNEVDVAYTFLVPKVGGVAGVYVGGTNVALSMLRNGLVVVHDPSLKCLPVKEQVLLLAAEKSAREEKRGFWEDTVTLGATK